MKKLLSIITLIAVFCTAFYTLPVTASTEPDYKSVGATISKNGEWVYVKPVDFPNNEIVVVQYKGTNTKVTVPEKIDNKTVVGVGDLYEESTDKYDSVIKFLPDNLNVTEVLLPKTVKSITDYCEQEYRDDEDCWQSGILAIPGYSSISPKKIAIIPSLSKQTLTKFVVASDNPYLCTQDGALYNKDKTVLLRYPAGITATEFIIPKSVKKVNIFAFANTKVKQVDFNNVSSISDYTFYKAKIEKVKGLDDIKELSKGMFLESALKEFPNIEKVSVVPDYAFAYCKKLESVELPLRVDWIGSHAFYYCNKLKEVDFGKITLIDAAAFAQCSALKEAILPETCKTLAGYAFSNCKSLEQIDLNRLESIGRYAFNKCYNLKDTCLGNVDNEIWVEEILSYAFNKCTSLKSILLWQTKVIEQKAFVDCTALKDIDFINIKHIDEIHADSFKNTAYVNNHKDGVVYIDEIALCYKKPKKAKTTISIKAGTTHIASYCLYKIDGVKQLYLPSSLKNVEAVNISECKDLKRVYISGKKTVFAEASCQNNYRSKTKYYIKSKAYDVLKHFDQKYYSFTTDWKPSKTKSMKAVGKTKSTAKITWKKQGYVTGYKVYMKTSKNGKWKKVATLKGSDSTSYTKKGLSKNKTYYFRVRAYKTVEGETYHGAYSSNDAAKTKKS